MIDATRLDEIFRNCLYKEDEVNGGEPPEGAVLVEGIMNKYGFHPERLEEHRTEVRAFLDALPVEFQLEHGGGWSFVNACVDRDGRQWGEHRNMEQLFVLGQALGAVKCLLPRDMWEMFPGGMPYYAVLPEGGAS